MSNLIVIVFCVAAGSGPRFHQTAELLWWILRQKPRTDPATRR